MIAPSPAHKSRCYLQCDGVFSKLKSLGFFGKVSPQHLLSVESRGGTSFKKNTPPPTRAIRSKAEEEDVSGI